MRFLTRPENRDPPTGPLVQIFCHFCQSEQKYRKVVPEDFDAANDKGVEQSLRNLYKKLTTPLSEGDAIKLDFLEEEEED